MANRKRKKPTVSRGNPVARNMEKFNRPATHMDRKKELKRNGPREEG